MKSDKKHLALTSILVFCICALVGGSAILYHRIMYEELSKEVSSLRKSVSSEFRKLRGDLFALELAAIVDRETEGIHGPRERALRLGRWIAGHISNVDVQGGDALTALCNRRGFCGTRSSLFVRMMSLENIPARRFNMYDFPTAGSSHACAQAYWDGQWHFFDVTYAGVFMKDGDVASWEEIVGDPVSALENMVVFRETRDTSKNQRSAFLPVSRVDNERRMSSFYNMESLTHPLLTWGFRSEPKVLKAPIDLSTTELPVTLGTRDGASNDLRRDAMAAGITGYIHLAFGSSFDNFHLEWTIRHLEPGRYELSTLFFDASEAGMHFRAEAEGAEILNDTGDFVSSDAVVRGQPVWWKILFEPQAPGNEAKITIRHDLPRGTGPLHPDQIILRKLAD